MPKASKVQLAKRNQVASKLIYNLGTQQTCANIEKKNYAGESYDNSVDGTRKDIMVFNSLTKSLDGTSSVLEAFSNGYANHIAITNENPNNDSAEKLASFDRSNKVSTRH